MTEYLELVLDVFDDVDQHASVRSVLTVEQLIGEIIREFEGLDPDPALYDLYPTGEHRPLERGKTLGEQGVEAGARLVFDRHRDAFRQLRGPINAPQIALREVSTQVLFLVKWQPALIGRPDVDPAHNELLAANLSWLAGGRRVSRRHARITERGGRYYVEALAERNPTTLNGRRLSIGRAYEMREGDTIGLGVSGISLVLVSQE